ncbi:hypothetical protein N0V83_006139 [Neocucurbitaria cava]|uniref:Uncharacterized protein n=1 Tax=Neocucurbitaria cava TaxID=798079 RepID=A0A9W8Y7D8_9PLEO|nr:hypothetical protein N0V83_006139 [Neocucurbitaria cava]
MKLFTLALAALAALVAATAGTTSTTTSTALDTLSISKREADQGTTADVKTYECSADYRGVRTCQYGFCYVEPGHWCKANESCRNDCACCKKNRGLSRRVEAVGVPEVVTARGEDNVEISQVQDDGCTPGTYKCYIGHAIMLTPARSGEKRLSYATQDPDLGSYTRYQIHKWWNTPRGCRCQRTNLIGVFSIDLERVFKAQAHSEWWSPASLIPEQQRVKHQPMHHDVIHQNHDPAYPPGDQESRR